MAVEQALEQGRVSTIAARQLAKWGAVAAHHGEDTVFKDLAHCRRHAGD
jgi:hypothetical protein